MVQLSRMNMLQDDDEDNSKSENWDESWKQYVDKKSSGGVFELPAESSDRNESDMTTDKRIDDLTSAWSNESGFLIGIVLIFFIACFYVYIRASGGISG